MISHLLCPFDTPERSGVLINTNIDNSINDEPPPTLYRADHRCTSNATYTGEPYKRVTLPRDRV